MNYKIRITAENQAIVKRIADENGMNPNNFVLNDERYLYEIQNNKFIYLDTIQKGEEETILTTEQFIELFDKKETEWKPKRGDRVLVWDSDEKPKERIFLAEIKGSVSPIVTVPKAHEVYFKNNETFGVTQYKHMKPLPIEQPKETDFKSKVIELIEKNINDKQEKLEFVINKNNLIYEAVLECIVAIQKDLLNQIKQL